MCPVLDTQQGSIKNRCQVICLGNGFIRESTGCQIFCYVSSLKHWKCKYWIVIENQTEELIYDYANKYLSSIFTYFH